MLDSRVLYLVPLLALGCGAPSSIPGDSLRLVEESNAAFEASESNSKSELTAQSIDLAGSPAQDSTQASINADSTDLEELPLNTDTKDFAAADACSNVVDECPVPGGVTWQCKKRFVHGVNY